MKKVAVISMLIVGISISFAQTVLIDPNAEGGFENGPGFAANGWTVVNDLYNKWEVGIAAKNGGGRGAYISKDDGNTNNYFGHIAQVSHFYRDVTFPAGETMIVLKFYLRGGFYTDDIRIFLIPTESTPIAGIQLTAAGQIGDYFANTFFNGDYMVKTVVIPSSAAGTTQRLVFSWRNNDTQEIPYAAAIDNISLVSEGSVTSNGTGGGNLSNPSTLIGGALGSGVNLRVRTGDAIVIDQDATVKNLALEPGATVNFDPVSNRRLTVQKDLIVSNGATVRSGMTGTANHDLVIGGNLFNDGTLDLSTNGGVAGVKIEFNGLADQTFSGSGITDISSMTIKTATSTATVLIAPENLTVKDLNANAPGFLNLEKGTARLSGSSPLESVVFTNASPTFATTTALWLDNPNLVVKGQNGNLTMNGRLRVSNGTTLNVGNAVDNFFNLGQNSESVFENAVINVSGSFGVVSPTHVVKVHFDASTLTVGTAGLYSDTRVVFDLGFSSSTNATSTASTIIIQNANTGTGGDYRTPLGFNITGSTLHLGNATTTAAQVFRVRGVVPDLVIDPTFNHTIQLFGASLFAVSTTIPPGAILDLNGNGLTLRGDLNITGGATLIGTATSSSLTFGGTVPQSFTNNGTLLDGYLRSLVVNNSSGATPAVAINNNLAISNSLFLTFGSLGGPGTLTLGNNLATATTTVTVVNGSMLTTPTFSPGTTFNMNYNTSLSPRTTGPELPSIVGTLTLNNVNGVILNATTTAQKLTLTNGTLTTATSSALTIAGTNPTDISFSPTSYVNGPIILTLPPSLDGSAAYSVPVGTTRQRVVKLIGTKTDATPNTRVFFQAYDYFGTASLGNGMGALTETQRWFVTALVGGGNVTETRLRFSGEGLGAGNRIGKSSTIEGTYNSIGGTCSGNDITSDVINSFSYFAIGITDNTFSGTYTVGSSGANYSTITAAVNAMKIGGFSAPVVLSLLDTMYSTETFPITLSQIAGASATNTLTIKPATGNVVKISGASSTGIFKLDGADYVTIDGSNNGTNSRDLSVTNTDSYPVIWLSSQGSGLGAKNNIIKNLILAGGQSQATSNVGGYGILASGTSPVLSSDGADNDNNIVHNNFVKKVRWGILFRGIAGNANEGNSITSNLIGPAEFGADQIGKSGIVVQHQSGVSISNNEVRTVGSIYPQINDAASEDRVGIGLGGDNWTPISTTVTNATVTGNIVHDIIDERTRSAVGILVAGVGTPSNNVITNNVIYNVRSNGTSGEQGIGIGIFTGNGDKIVFNSIRMEGDIDPVGSTTSTGSNVGIRVNSGSNLTIKNNIVSVDLTSNTDTVKHYAIVAPSFYNWGTGGLNYNDYYVNSSNTQMKIGGIGSTIPYTSSADITAWKTNFSGTQDANSTSFTPDFMSATNLHLNLGSVNTNYIALPIAGVTTDIDGDMRSTTAPYKGADENTVFQLPDLIAPSAPLNVAITDSGVASITLRWRKNSESDFLRYRIYGRTSGNITSKIDSTTGGIGDTTKTISALTNGIRYYFRVTAVDKAGNESGFSNEVNAVPADRVAPAAPQNLVVADSSNAKIGIKWKKNADADVLEYRIYRATSPNASVKVDSTADTSKTFTGLTNGVRYYLRVTAVDSSGNESGYSNEVNGTPHVVSDVDGLNSQVPKDYSLSQNYPNPFNPSTVIRYGLPVRSHVTLIVYNLLGQRITLLTEEVQDAHFYEVKWLATISSGLYFYRLQAVSTEDPNKSFVQVRKMLMIK